MEGGFPVQAFGAYLVGNQKTLAAGAGGTESLNLFQIIGTVEIEALMCEVTTALSAGALDAAHFEQHDGAAAIDLTLNTGVISSLGIGSMFFKGGLVGENFTVLDNAVGAFAEHAADLLVFKRFVVTKKLGAATYVRLTYHNSGGGAATGVVRPSLIWRPKSQDGLVLPV